ncbi:MAG: TolC family outer membrane protein [Betaproteobacteria bacterium]|nr:TolC family outer membrane protein [Betaproteobacteria bacterium]
MTGSIRGFVLVASFAAAQATGASDLMQVYRDARGFDAQYSAARYALRAGLEKLPQGRALVLPTLGLTAGDTRSHLGLDPYGPNPVPHSARTFYNRNYQLNFSQPIYRPQNWLQSDQGELQVKQAEAIYGQAGQDLVVRVAQAYFDVLASEDTLALVRAQKAAIAEQLAQARRNFEVGTATITDTHEAQARFDLSSAQEISALNDLENKARALQQIAGKSYDKLSPLRPDVKLAPPNPNNMQPWVELADKQAYPVVIQEAVAEIASLSAKSGKLAHHPTLDLVAGYGQTWQTGSTISGNSAQLNLGSIGLQFAVPLYQGGAISSREREAAALYEKSKEDLQNARRSSVLLAQQSYLTVINGIAQVGALEQALVSSQSALDSNKLGYEVGVRINIDVLNAQQQLFSTRRDLALARYNTITSHLRLKGAAGSLKEEDLEEVNRALAP